MGDTDKQSQEEMEGDGSSAAPVSSTPRSSSPTGSQPNSIPLGNVSSDRQAVQVIQQTLHRPQSMTAQYLQQMYAAQQQHILLQTAALQQQHQQSLTAAQILTTTEQLILAPAATVAAVQPDLTVVSSMSSHSASSQVQSLALRTHLPGALATAQNIQIKPPLQGQTLVSPLPKMSICPLKSTQLSQNLVETSRSESQLTDVTQPPSAQPHIPPSTFTPVQSHTLVRHQLHCPSGQRVTPHQFIIQQSAAAHRQVQPIALRVTPQESSPLPLALQTRTTPTTATVQSQHTEFLSVPSSANQAANQSAVPPAALPDPPPLHLGPVLEPVSQYSPLACPPPLTMGLPRLVQPQRLSLRSVQTVAVQSDHMLSEEEHPVDEAVVQLPFQNLPPPQTVAVDLKMQPATQTEAPSATPLLKESESMNLLKDVEHVCPQYISAPTPPPQSPPDESQRTSDDVTAQPENRTADPEQPCIQSSRSVIRSPEDPTHANSSPPPLLSSAVRSTSRLPPASLPGNPEGRPSQAIVRPHILTHLIEGFVIREGLEPFPVRHASLEMNLQATLPEDREDGESARDDCLMDVEHPENSTDSDIDNPPAEDEQTDENLPDVLECEFCGKRGFARTFLRSKRFCSMTCVRRFNVSCKKRLNLFRPEKVGRWPHRPMGRRGRPPSRVNGGSREHYLRQQLQDSHRSNDNQRVSDSVWIEREEEDPPGPMTTRLRLQAEREKEQDREREQSRLGSCSSSDCVLDSSPSQWSVEQVCSFISSLPGCHDIAAEFQSQEIDGQALLLLTEDHLMNAMNMKLGPALKICAQINALKEP
ncbi:polyhomeotic-like protein 3 isoform X6 [Chanodichthys erythropterus]|uniref:polyhomeotic-like protein 3 isoform X6 n=1 Tax=Chanodichthys erythropterus TaxID=933992 RepID=UPI00351F3EB4